jgi:hypothetical protein
LKKTRDYQAVVAADLRPANGRVVMAALLGASAFPLHLNQVQPKRTETNASFCLFPCLSS